MIDLLKMFKIGDGRVKDLLIKINLTINFLLILIDIEYFIYL